MGKSLWKVLSKNLLAVIGSILFVSICSPPYLFGNDLPLAKPEEVGLSSVRLARIGPAMQRYID